METDCLEFWNRHAKGFPRLHRVAMRVLSVPATSVPVERVFSQGGIIMDPHRARLSAKKPFMLNFVCNDTIFFDGLLATERPPKSLSLM